jgi:hypothetical protein
MKKIIYLLCLIIIVFSFAACRQAGNTSNTEISISKSTKFSEKEINLAVSSVKKKFKDFKGCKLTKLWYDEEMSDNFAGGYMQERAGTKNDVKPENIIILLSNFDVDSSGGDGSLNPDSTYSNWNWILVRDSKTGAWQVKDWGY